MNTKPRRPFWNLEVRKTGENEFKGFGTELSYSKAVQEAKQYAEKYSDDDVRVVETVGVVWKNF